MSLANSLRTLKAYAQAVGTQIGTGLASAIRHVVVWLNQMMKYVLKASQAFATFMQTIFGKYKGGASGIAFDATAMEEDVGNVADAADGIGEGLDNASNSAKQLKKDLSVLPFDELNQLNKDREEASSGSGSGGAGGAGGAGGLGDGLLDWGDLLENSEVGKLPDWISKWGKRVKAAFFANDWTRLGETLAEMINEGVKKIYDVLDFEKFKKKVDPFITGFVRTFNSLISNIDWDLIGRTIGRFVNDMVYSMNRLLTEINWKKIGKSIASFANGLVDEIDFKEVGRLIGNKFMVLWRTLYGFATDFDWKKFGKKLADGINGINDSINLSDISRALTTFLNGIFTTLKELADKIEWGDIAKNISSGINTFISEFSWKENGESLGKFLDNLCDTLISIIDQTDWEGLGQGIADFLAQLPWSKLLRVVGKAIVSALGGILKGMASTPAGALASALITGITAFKIGTKLDRFVTNIANILTGGKSTSVLGKAGGKLAEKIIKGVGAKSAAGSLGATASAVGASVGIGALTASLPIAATKIAEFNDKVKGGNGLLTETGTALHDYTEKLRTNGQITDTQKKTLDRMIESREKENMTQEESKSLIDDVNSRLATYGVTAEGASGYLQNLHGNGVLADEMFKTMDESVKSVNTNLAETKGSGDNASLSFDTLRNSINELNISGFDTDYDLMLDTLNRTEAEGGTAEDAYVALQKTIGETGGDVKTFQHTVETANDKIKTNTTTTWEDIQTGLGTWWDNIKTSADEKWSNIKTSLASWWERTKTSASTKFGALRDDISKKWDNINKTAGEKWNTIKNTLTNKWKTLVETAQGKFKGIREKASKAWENIKSDIGNAWDGRKGVISTLKEKVEGIKDVFKNLSLKIPKPSIPEVYVSWRERVTNDDGSWYEFPHWDVRWFKKGGLFMGGKGQVVGLAEDGRDEAVLPLENTKVMSRIGNAIASASDGIGLTKGDIIDAVVTAMALNPSTQEVIVNAVLKMENDEVLARHVERGRRRMDQRFNPVASY